MGIFYDEKPILIKTIRYSVEQLKNFKTAFEQLDMRQNDLLHAVESEGIPFEFDAIIGRGGLTHPIPAGVYEVNERMLHDTLHAERQHVCNLACHIAHSLAQRCETAKALIADPEIVDEMLPEAHICGSPLMHRASVWHALNQRAIARRFAQIQGVHYEDLNLIIAHLGGGITVGAHQRGRTVDVNNGLDGEGPFSPERAGSLPAADLIRLCFSGKYTEAELLKRIAGKAGLNAHLGTTDAREVMERIEAGDQHAKLIFDAMIYHTAKAIAAQSAVLSGEVNAILITGGLAHSEYITAQLRQRVGFIAPIHVFPGENEIESLAENALSALRGEREIKEYQ